MTESTKKNIDILLPGLLAGGAGYVYFKKGKNPQALIVLMLIAFGVGYLIVSQITRILEEASLKSQDRANQETVLKQYGLTQADYVRAGQICDSIYHAFHDSQWSEDEAKAIDAINSAGSVPMLKVIAQIYQQRYGYDIKGEFDRYTSSYNYWETPLADIVKTTLNFNT